MSKKSKRIDELDQLVEKWQETKDETIANEIYKRFKVYLYYYGNEHDEVSDANLALARAMKTWDKNSNVWFITWFKMLWQQHRNELSEYRKAKKRTGKIIIPLDKKIDEEDDTLFHEIITDEDFEKKNQFRQKKQMLVDFFNEHNISDRERYLMLNIFDDTGKFQTEMAKELGISQAMTHKAIKKIHTKPYAEELKKLLTDMMRHD